MLLLLPATTQIGLWDLISQADYSSTESLTRSASAIQH